MILNADLFRRVNLAASTDKTRYYLNGVHVEPHKDGAIMVATNGHIMIVALDRTAKNVTESALIALGKDMLKAAKPSTRIADGCTRLIVRVRHAAIVRNSPDCEPYVLLDSPDDSVLAEQRHGTLIDGTFPDWRHVVPHGDPVPFQSPAYNTAHLHTLGEALCDNPRTPLLSISGVGTFSPESGPALIRGTLPDIFGVAMPARQDLVFTGPVPSWMHSTAPEALAEAA